MIGAKGRLAINAMVLTIAVAGIVAHTGLVGAAGSSGVSSNSATVDTTLQFGHPLGPPRLTATEALSVLEQTYEPQLFQHGYTTVFGAFSDPGLQRRVAGIATAVGPVDAWKFTITGLNLLRPCGVIGNCPPPAHTLMLFVDDKTGTLLEGDEY
jgi:hypothetical protein